MPPGLYHSSVFCFVRVVVFSYSKPNGLVANCLPAPSEVLGSNVGQRTVYLLTSIRMVLAGHCLDEMLI